MNVTRLIFCTRHVRRLLLSVAAILTMIVAAKSGAQSPSSGSDELQGVLAEYWTGLNKSTEIEGLTHDPNYPLNPSVRTIITTNFQAPTKFEDCYGVRMRGWLTPPATGDYTFFIKADDAGELWLSADDNPARRRRIASAAFITLSWNYYSEQQSEPIHLEAGKPYYIEALMKQGVQRDWLAVAWRIPGSNEPVLIAGHFLKPFNNRLGGGGLTSDKLTGSAGVGAELPDSTVFDRSADARYQIQAFETPTDSSGAQLVRGYIHPPTNGNYVFLVSGTDTTIVSLGSDNSPSNLQVIVQITSARQGSAPDGSVRQQSPPVYLEAGKAYYIEAIQKSRSGAGRLSVGWQLPEGTAETPIPPSRLTPYDADEDGLPDWFELREGLSPNESGDAQADADGDGSNNLAEFRAGTRVHYREDQSVWRGVLWEYWKGLGDSPEISSLARNARYPINPDGRMILVDFETQKELGDNYGGRLRGWLQPPVTGDYTFWISSDDNGELWLSGDADPSVKRLIANVPAFTAHREWDKYTEQKSTTIRLEADKKYYIEAIMKEGTEQDHFSVGWQTPGVEAIEIIPGRYVIPYNDGAGGEGISREVWRQVPGTSVDDLKSAMARSADIREQRLQFEAPGDWGDDYGQLLRGYIWPPTNGNYVLWLAASDSAVLSLGMDETPFQRREIARVDVPTGVRDWNYSAQQKSLPVTLEGGKAYYIELVHKAGKGADHAAVAWHLPDGNIEAPIPGTRLTPYDSDSDGMPDWYERSNGLDPHIAADAAYDHDFDGLSNSEEYQLRTDPQRADTSGDGIPDGIAVMFGGNPADSNPELLFDVARIDGFSAKPMLGRWETNGTDLVAKDRRGAVEFTISLKSADKFLLQLEAAQNIRDSRHHRFDLAVSIDGESLGHQILVAGTNEIGASRWVTPFLVPGDHKVRVFWDGAANSTSLRIKQLKVRGIADPKGTQADSRMKTWVRGSVELESGLNGNIPTNSHVSPVCLEGRDPYLSMLKISDSLTGEVIPVFRGAGPRWYANVPLSTLRDAQVSFSYQNGAKTEQRTVRWQPLNVFAGGTIVIRKGDTLLLGAPDDLSEPVDSYVRSGTQLLEKFEIGAKQTFTYRFNDAGNFLINTISRTLNRGVPATGNITVQVVSYDFPDDPLCMVNRMRVWDLTNVPPGLVLEADPRLRVTEVHNGTGRRLSLLSNQNETGRVIARSERGGSIIGSAETRSVRVFATPDTYNIILEQYPEGSKLVETMDILSPLYSDAVLQINVIAGGVTFDDGTTYRELAAPAFDVLGQGVLRFHLPPGTQTANCHRIKLRQGAVTVGTY